MKGYFSALLIMVFGLTGLTNQEMYSDPVVHAVFFTSPSCPHCRKVIMDLLVPMLEEYDESLEFFVVNIATSEGASLYHNAIEQFGIPERRRGVPTLIVGETVLVGSLEIPEEFPSIVDQGLEKGGVHWPDIPGLADFLVAPLGLEQDTVPNTASSGSINSPLNEKEEQTNGDSFTNWHGSTADSLTDMGEQDISVREKLLRDPVGNAFSIVVLFGMTFSLVGLSVRWLRKQKVIHAPKHAAAIPVLCIVGLFIAGYLAFVETSGTVAVCGPIGDCNTVQQSKYATLFGFLPIGLLGLVGYVIIVTSWLVARLKHLWLADLSRVVLLVLTIFGFLFSAYLTFLEPFVIGATCAWCLTSAIIMTALMWLAAEYAAEAIYRLKKSSTRLLIRYRRNEGSRA